MREANGIAEIPGFSERRAPAVVELITVWKALQDRKAVHEECEVVVWLEHGISYDEVCIGGVAENETDVKPGSIYISCKFL